MKIALAQINIAWENPKENLIKCENFIKNASEKKADLIIFPEMALTGFTMNINSLKLKEEFILEWAKRKAFENNINISLGYGIKCGEKGKNKFCVVSPKNTILGLYTKIHPFSYSKEDEKYYKGNEIISCKVGEASITPFICYDLRFPEIFQIASKKSEIIIVIASWPKEREEHWVTLLKARAIENQCFIIGVNRVGEGDGLEYSGASLIFDPLGNSLNEKINKEELIIKDINLSSIKEVREKINIKRDRREKLYKESEVKLYENRLE